MKVAVAYPKKLQGLCIGVLSGDRILFQGPLDKQNGGFKQKVLYLSGIQAPKYDLNSGKEEKFGYASRQFMREMLVGKKLQFVIERKTNEMEVGYVLQNGQDVSVLLLKEGLAKLRSDKSGSEHLEQYKHAEKKAQNNQIGIWKNTDDQSDYRNLRKVQSEEELVKNYRGKTFTAVVEQIHPSKLLLYITKQNLIVTLTFSEIQTVVISEKLANGQTKNNVRVIKSILQSSFLHRQVTVFVSETSKENFIGYIVNSDGVDIRKVLLENGFAKLSKEAMQGVSAKQFMQLKKAAQLALESGKGLWKQQKVSKSTSSNSKQYTAMVVEVHSGDSISVRQNKKQTIRIFFPHIRAPSSNQPWSFESKQVLRKKCIGKIVKVQVEFIKRIPIKKLDGSGEQIKDFICASVFDGDVNLGAYMLQQGLVSFQQIRTEEDVSKYLEELKQAEKKSKKQKKGLNKGQSAKIPTFNDVSGGKGKKIDAGKAKTLFGFLQDQPHLTGVIEVVLNGSRFKVRFNQQNVMAIVVLDGVRCLTNEGQFAKLSEQALAFSKQNILQRDCEIKLKRVDLKGVYHSELIVGKKDWASELLENGLAVTIQRNKNQIYDKIEEKARKDQIGLWKYDLNLSSIKGETQKQFKMVNFTKTLILVEVPNVYQFYLQSETCKKPEVSQKPTPVANLKVGDLCAAQFTDGIYYRAKVVKQTKNGYQVHFIDYGNYDNVPKSKIGLLDETLKKSKSPLFRASLYGLENLTKQAYNILCENISKKLKTQIKQQAQDGECRVILTDNNVCINLDLLELGEAENTTTNPEWEKAEETARKNREGKWSEE